MSSINWRSEIEAALKIESQSSLQLKTQLSKNLGLKIKCPGPYYVALNSLILKSRILKRPNGKYSLVVKQVASHHTDKNDEVLSQEIYSKLGIKVKILNIVFNAGEILEAIEVILIFPFFFTITNGNLAKWPKSGRIQDTCLNTKSNNGVPENLAIASYNCLAKLLNPRYQKKQPDVNFKKVDMETEENIAKSAYKARPQVYINTIKHKYSQPSLEEIFCTLRPFDRPFDYEQVLKKSLKIAKQIERSFESTDYS